MERAPGLEPSSPHGKCGASPIGLTRERPQKDVWTTIADGRAPSACDTQGRGRQPWVLDQPRVPSISLGTWGRVPVTMTFMTLSSMPYTFFSAGSVT